MLYMVIFEAYVTQSSFPAVNQLNNFNPKSNIFVDEDWHVRLADFGLADWADTTLTTNTNNHAGSIRWMAPELHNYEASVRRTAASDTYSFAFVCIEVRRCKLDPLN